nr:hypothetical protein [Proteiniphilum sp. UBA5375]
MRSPCSTEGMPRITSTDSMLSVEMERMSRPELGDEPPPIEPPPPLMAGESVCRLALFDRGAPSITMAVPMLFILAASAGTGIPWLSGLAPRLRILKVLADERPLS